MMAAQVPDAPRLVLVEGKKDVSVIQALISRTLAGKGGRSEAVAVLPIGGTPNLTLGTFKILLQAQGRSVVGVVLDSDDSPRKRWDQLYRVVRESSATHGAPDLPPTTPQGSGWISAPGAKIRVGIYLLPSPLRSGMLETLLWDSIPESMLAIKDHAATCTAAVPQNDERYKDAHRDKARLYSFMAWTHEPDRDLVRMIQSLPRGFTPEPLRPVCEWLGNLLAE